MSIEWPDEIRIVCDVCGREGKIGIRGHMLDAYVTKSELEEIGWLIEVGNLLCKECAKPECKYCGSKDCEDEECIHNYEEDKESIEGESL